MDIKLLDAEATPEERQAVDARLGEPHAAWYGTQARTTRELHVAFGGKDQRDRRHLLLPALQALQERIGWISEGGFNYVCERLTVPPAEAWGVATFYMMLSTQPRPKRVLHVCDDIACRAKGAKALCDELTGQHGGPLPHGIGKGDGHAAGHAGNGAAPGPHSLARRDSAGRIVIDDSHGAWTTSPCLGLCDVAPAALYIEAGPTVVERSLGSVDGDFAMGLLGGGAEPDDVLASVGPAKETQSTQNTQTTAKYHTVTGCLGEPRLLKRIGVVNPTSLTAYQMGDGYEALEKAFELGPEGVIAELNAAKLLGRGGAAFPTGRKWDAVRQQEATPKYIICNADESEPGTFKDRVLLTGDPFAIIEAMTIGAYAAGCTRGYVYIRGEYPLGAQRMQHAIKQARAIGLLGPKIMKRDFSFDIEVRRGAGAYICGEETAIFESIEGKRGEPRNKPPFPVSHGVFGKPTIVNNVETLANVIPIILGGGAAAAKIGTEQSAGTRLFCMSGHVARPGVYEVPMGTTLGELMELAGGVSGSGKLQCALLGGAAGAFVRPDEMNLRLTHEDTRAAGVTLGSGVVVAFDDTVDMLDMIHRIAKFFRDESCGQCVPCRVGTVRQQEALHRIAAKKPHGSVQDELALLEEIGVAMKDGSICGLGQTAYAAVESAIKRLNLYPV
ncbi:MAG: NAD(P)H-dependent oxidoreductase subunit E [Gemmatimonadetes bacterium]|nr:NAD(P)H-dependent oxidoreductase subunit E [Gemmatimonadota bacterium]